MVRVPAEEGSVFIGNDGGFGMSTFLEFCTFVTLASKHAYTLKIVEKCSLQLLFGKCKVFGACKFDSFPLVD